MGEFEERWAKLEYTTQLYGKYMMGDYEPPKGVNPIPMFRTKINLDKVFVDDKKYLLTQGIPHPIYKNLYYYGKSSKGKQDWKIGEGRFPKSISPPFNKKFLKVGLKHCSNCKKILEVEKFGKNANKRQSAEWNYLCKKCRRKISRKSKETESWKEKRRIRDRKRNSIPAFKMHDRISASLRSTMRFVNKRKSKRAFEYLGCSYQEFYDKKFPKDKIKDKEWKYNIDHIVPISVALECHKRKLVDDETLLKLIYALWHYSNLQIICENINKYVKSDFYKGERVRNMADDKILKIAKDIINKTESIRKLDTKKSSPEE